MTENNADVRSEDINNGQTTFLGASTEYGVLKLAFNSPGISLVKRTFIFNVACKVDHTKSLYQHVISVYLKWIYCPIDRPEIEC